MKKYLYAAFILDAFLLGAIIVIFFNSWIISAALLIITGIIIVERLRLDNISKNNEKKLSSYADSVGEGLGTLATKVEEIKYDINKHMFVIHNKLESMKSATTSDIKLIDNGFSSRIERIETELNLLKISLENAYKVLEDRIDYMEGKEEILRSSKN